MSVGIDLVSPREVEEAIAALGSRYLDRVFTELEQRQSGGDPHRLAIRFAGKEATVKALGSGGNPSLPWRSIEVRRRGSGHFALTLTGAASEHARRCRVQSLALSVAGRRSTAVAIVVATLAPQADPAS